MLRWRRLRRRVGRLVYTSPGTSSCSWLPVIARRLPAESWTTCWGDALGLFPKNFFDVDLRAEQVSTTCAPRSRYPSVTNRKPVARLERNHLSRVRAERNPKRWAGRQLQLGGLAVPEQKRQRVTSVHHLCLPVNEPDAKQQAGDELSRRASFFNACLRYWLAGRGLLRHGAGCEASRPSKSPASSRRLRGMAHSVSQ